MPSLVSLNCAMQVGFSSGADGYVGSVQFDEFECRECRVMQAPQFQSGPAPQENGRPARTLVVRVRSFSFQDASGLSWEIPARGSVAEGSKASKVTGESAGTKRRSHQRDRYTNTKKRRCRGHGSSLTGQVVLRATLALCDDNPALRCTVCALEPEIPAQWGGG